MKKLLAFSGIILFAFIGCGQNHNPLIMGRQYYEPGTKKPFNGEKTFHYFSGKIKTKATFVNGYPEIVINFDRDQNKRSKLLF